MSWSLKILHEQTIMTVRCPRPKQFGLQPTKMKKQGSAPRLLFFLRHCVLSDPPAVNACFDDDREAGGDQSRTIGGTAGC